MQLSFHGGVRGVTGSCFLIETKKAKVLIDCGMFQGERMVAKDNLRKFGFDPKKINALIITHAHYDHTGRVPVLTQQGFNGSIFTTPPTKALTLIILEDAQHVMEENFEKYGDEILFKPADIQKMHPLMQGINYHTQFEPIPGLSAMFHDAGHILGSAYVSIDVAGSETKNGQPMRIVFSGDIGNDGVPILPETEPISSADVIVAESTYGNRDHEPVFERGLKLSNFITKIINRGGTVLIPAFSIERTQELLYEMDQLIEHNLIPEVPIFLDSPLAIKATGIYRDFKHYLQFDASILESIDKDFFSFPNLQETLSVDASKVINRHQEPKIIIAGSGMMTGGRILHHALRYLPDEKSGILFIGYQAEGTLGRQIIDGKKKVHINREDVELKATIEAIGSFSAHGDRSKIARWLQPEDGPVKEIYLVHGDTEVKAEFKLYLEDRLPGKIHIPKYQEKFEY
ncbi:MAG: MBL fold metallo-hydrolase [Patescibacteria group bacterium]